MKKAPTMEEDIRTLVEVSGRIATATKKLLVQHTKSASRAGVDKARKIIARLDKAMYGLSESLGHAICVSKEKQPVKKAAKKD